jgi:hypothetical protein
MSLTCNRKINLTNQDIYEIGIKPLLENISLAITTSLVQQDVFGCYNISHILVIGKTMIDIFSTKEQQENLLFSENITAQHLKMELIQGLEAKELDISCSVLLSQSLYELSKPTTGESLKFLTKNFICGGCLQQVASEDYTIDFTSVKSGSTGPEKLSYKVDGVGCEYVIDPVRYDFIVEKGEPLCQEKCRTYHIFLSEGEELQEICRCESSILMSIY